MSRVGILVPTTENPHPSKTSLGGPPARDYCGVVVVVVDVVSLCTRSAGGVVVVVVVSVSFTLWCFLYFVVVSVV